MPCIVTIVYTPRGVERRPNDRFARVPLERATLVEGRGIAEDLKANSGERQLNIMRAETLAQLAVEGRKTGPGEMGEQLVLAGLEPAHFAEWVQLRLGSTVLVEIGIPRTGCDRFDYIQLTTKKDVARRLGVMARVIAGGEAAVGDEIHLSSTNGTV